MWWMCWHWHFSSVEHERSCGNKGFVIYFPTKHPVFHVNRNVSLFQSKNKKTAPLFRELFLKQHACGSVRRTFPPAAVTHCRQPGIRFREGASVKRVHNVLMFPGWRSGRNNLKYHRPFLCCGLEHRKITPFLHTNLTYLLLEHSCSPFQSIN